MSNEQIFAIISTALITLLGGGLLGAIYTGRATKAEIVRTGADALKTYQEIAAIASAAELQARNERAVYEKRCDEVIRRLEASNEMYLKENEKMKEVLSHWSAGIVKLHEQINEIDKDKKPAWSPTPEDLAFLVK
jgi:hypothetical protein